MWFSENVTDVHNHFGNEKQIVRMWVYIVTVQRSTTVGRSVHNHTTTLEVTDLHNLNSLATSGDATSVSVTNFVNRRCVGVVIALSTKSTVIICNTCWAVQQCAVAAKTT